MANVPETPDYPAGIYQLETSDPVLGGPGGIANLQAEQLANRTAWLKEKIDAFIAGTVAVYKATRLATARTLSISGAGSGSASFDGSANATIALTLADSGVAAGTYAKVTVNAKGLVTGGAPLTAADIPTSTQVEAEAGVENTKPATSLRVFQAIRSATAMATEALRGVLRVATQAEVDAGTLDNVAVTPKKLLSGFSFTWVGGETGVIAFPVWLGGFVIQFGRYAFIASNVDETFNLPIPFPNTFFAVLMTDAVNATPSQVSAQKSGLGQVLAKMAAGTGGAFFIALGR